MGETQGRGLSRVGETHDRLSRVGETQGRLSRVAETHGRVSNGSRVEVGKGVSDML